MITSPEREIEPPGPVATMLEASRPSPSGSLKTLCTPSDRLAVLTGTQLSVLATLGRRLIVMVTVAVSQPTAGAAAHTW